MAHIFSRTMHRIISATVALLCLTLCIPAHAQFAGSGIGAKTPVNIPVVPTTDQAILFPQDPTLVLEQGDLLNFHIYGSPDYTPTVRVSADGTILLPLIGLVPVRGLTVQQAEKKVAAALMDAGMYVNPQVNIQVTETPNHLINVLGEVKGQALISAAVNRHLLDALDAAGGMNADASHVITILRPSVPQPIVVDLGVDPMQSAASNIPVFSGDTIIVSHLGSYYVLGAVKGQGVFPLKSNSPTTLIDALATANGVLFEAKQGDVRIIRTTGTTRTAVPVNLSRVVDGKDPDPILEADDIVYVPSSTWKSAIKAGGLGTLLGAASIAVVVATR
ncbi:MAG: polysaccharide export protein [Acidobacteriaceae bacterium]|nr:polysaccharide export protein [Acidobacteriaceae bacterium]